MASKVNDYRPQGDGESVLLVLDVPPEYLGEFWVTHSAPTQSGLRDGHGIVAQDYLPQRREIIQPRSRSVNRGPASLSGGRDQGGSHLRAVRLLPHVSNQTRQTVMRNSPSVRTPTAGVA